MKYRLGDICTITKGATGIMKAVPGPYPMVTLAEERKQHDEYQFDAAAVIVPLISSTGHGHASIKRIHYQEGKFALGTILCAVIPKDEALLNPRYLFVYLQQFKDSVLVPLMKGAANVSLPLNKLAALKIEVPTLAKQQEVIDLAHVLTGHRNDLETLLNAQKADTVKLRQALLREAMQGQLLPQDPTDEPATQLLKKLQAAKAATGKGAKGKAGTLFTEEVEEVEGLHEIPESWVWCTLDSICNQITDGAHHTPDYKESGVPFLSVKDISNGFINFSNTKYISSKSHEELIKRCNPEHGDVLLTKIGTTGVAKVIDSHEPFSIFVSVCLLKFNQDLISGKFLEFLINSPFVRKQSFDGTWGVGNKNLVLKTIKKFVLCLPPLAEQHRIAAKLEQLLQHCDALEQRIRESRRLAEQLLQTALREALAPPGGTEPSEETASESIEVEPASPAPRRGRPLKKRLAANDPDLFSELADLFGVE